MMTSLVLLSFFFNQDTNLDLKVIRSYENSQYLEAKLSDVSSNMRMSCRQ